MGAREHVLPRLGGLLPADLPLAYVGRPEHASPAEGYAKTHSAEQERIINAAYEVGRAARVGGPAGVRAEAQSAT